MRQYEHPWEEPVRMRVSGSKTGEVNLSFNYSFINGIEGNDFHFHEGSTELYVPHRGSFILWVEGKLFGLRPGREVRVDQGERHKFVTLYQAPVGIFAIQSPSVLDKKVLEMPSELKEMIESAKNDKNYLDSLAKECGLS